MNFKVQKWCIAYRKRHNILSDDLCDFRVIKNNFRGWRADPFVFNYEKQTYLFAEYYSYYLHRGVIVCAKYNANKGKFGKFKEIIREDYHLSYPVVFCYNDEIFMMPESAQSEKLYMYKAISFPDKWEKQPAVAVNVSLVDTTPIVVGNELYALSLKKTDSSNGQLILLKFNGKSFEKSAQEFITDDMSIARPGGNFITIGNKLYRVSQDCSNGYGYGINIIEISDDFTHRFSEKIVRKILPQEPDLNVHNEILGIHTYNCDSQIEVIDFKFNAKSYFRVFLKFLNKFKK